MENIELLSKQTLENLKQQNKVFSPENYEREFFKLSTQQNIFFEEKQQLDSIKNNLCKIEKKSINENVTFKEISEILIKRINSQQVKLFLKDLSHFMAPSLSKDIKNDIDKFCEEISNNPNQLINIDNLRRLRELTNLRIKDDKNIYNEKNEDIKKLIRFLVDIFTKTVNETNITLDKIIEIKNEIKNLDLSDSSAKQISLLHKKLINNIDEIENKLKVNNESIINSQKDTNDLYDQIENLKCSLDKAEEEKSIDYLTGVLTRRAFAQESKRADNEYNVFDAKYAVVFFDIDHFKKINDKYGHDCGDSVLYTFASILNRLTRNEDIICRYGGEEFVAIIHYNCLFDVTNYLKRVKNIISSNKFIYRENKIEVKFSAGVALRINYNNFDETLNFADKLLYKAKGLGRNKIILDNNEVL
jgi:diguanylate cyclase (GGDEF)-like protein